VRMRKLLEKLELALSPCRQKGGALSVIAWPRKSQLGGCPNHDGGELRRFEVGLVRLFDSHDLPCLEVEALVDSTEGAAAKQLAQLLSKSNSQLHTKLWGKEG